MTMDIIADFHCQGPKPSVKGGLELAVNTQSVVVREGVCVVLIHYLAFGYRLLHGLFVVTSRW